MRRLAIAFTITALTLPVFAQDSPLVAAAKRSNRLGKKPANVITNETVAASRGRLATSASSSTETAATEQAAKNVPPSVTASPASAPAAAAPARKPQQAAAPVAAPPRDFSSLAAVVRTPQAREPQFTTAPIPRIVNRP